MDEEEKEASSKEVRGGEVDSENAEGKVIESLEVLALGVWELEEGEKAEEVEGREKSLAEGVKIEVGVTAELS